MPPPCADRRPSFNRTVRADPQVEPEIYDFARRMISRWEPDRAYVLDVWLTDDGLEVGEINNINSAGWYASDVQHLVMALEASRSRASPAWPVGLQGRDRGPVPAGTPPNPPAS